MKTTVRVLLMSQISDMQLLLKEELSDKDRHVMGFMKFLIAKFPRTEMEIDADEEYKRYMKALVK